MLNSPSHVPRHLVWIAHYGHHDGHHVAVVIPILERLWKDSFSLWSMSFARFDYIWFPLESCRSKHVCLFVWSVESLASGIGACSCMWAFSWLGSWFASAHWIQSSKGPMGVCQTLEFLVGYFLVFLVSFLNHWMPSINMCNFCPQKRSILTGCVVLLSDRQVVLARGFWHALAGTLAFEKHESFVMLWQFVWHLFSIFFWCSLTSWQLVWLISQTCDLGPKEKEHLEMPWVSTGICNISGLDWNCAESAFRVSLWLLRTLGVLVLAVESQI